MTSIPTIGQFTDPLVKELGFKAALAQLLLFLGEQQTTLSMVSLAQGAGVIGKATLADLNADLAKPADTVAYVTNDPTAANNVVYRKIGASGTGSWQQQGTGVFASQTQLTATETALNASLAKLLTRALSLSDTDFESPDSTIRQLMGPSDGGLVWALIDAAGKMAAGVDVNGRFCLHERLSFLRGADLLAGEYNYDFAVVDADDHVIFGILDGVPQSAQLSIADSNQTNLAEAQAVKGTINTAIERNSHKYNHIIVYGQSLSTGHEGWPALSKTAKYGNLMLGDCVRPTSTAGEGFDPFGGPSLKPLIANVQSGTSLLNDAQVAALAPGNGALGEVVNQGMVNFAKRLHNDYMISANDTARLFVTTNNGVSGRTIEELSKGASPDLYSRITGAVTALNGIAAAEGASYAVTGVVWMQGEYNYQSSFGGTTDKDIYKSKLVQLRSDINADVTATTGQDRNPAFITYQTGGSYTRDDVNLSVGMAQWEFARENAGCYLAGPIYPYTDKGGHLDSNGYRWYGNLLGKVYHRIVTLGQDWKPLSPRRVRADLRHIHIDFHVPEPPLVLDLPYVVNAATDYSSKGFKVTDDAGTVTIDAVEVVADTVVRLTLSRPLSTNPYVWYASQASSGNGCLRDSDTTIAHDRYEYTEGSGQYASANIPALVGNPYPMHNWCVAFRLPTTWSE